jgi:hypothetical protein
MYPYGYPRRLSSRPTHLTAPNGLNFSRSVGNPTSRLERVRDYLRIHGAATKKEILRDVFGKTIVPSRPQYTIVQNNTNPNEVSYGWGCYLFGCGVNHGFFTKVRRGNTVYWSLR